MYSGDNLAVTCLNCCLCQKLDPLASAIKTDKTEKLCAVSFPLKIYFEQVGFHILKGQFIHVCLVVNPCFSILEYNCRPFHVVETGLTPKIVTHEGSSF